jgi:hypothetical protein
MYTRFAIFLSSFVKFLRSEEAAFCGQSPVGFGIVTYFF